MEVALDMLGERCGFHRRPGTVYRVRQHSVCRRCVVFFNDVWVPHFTDDTRTYTHREFTRHWTLDTAIF